MIMRLRELCEETNVSRRAIQGYEAANLVKATGKNKYGYLIYNEEAQARVKAIKTYQLLGFSLREICEMIDAEDAAKLEALKKRLSELTKKSKEVDESITLVKNMIDELQTKVNCT